MNSIVYGVCVVHDNGPINITSIVMCIALGLLTVVGITASIDRVWTCCVLHEENALDRCWFFPYDNGYMYRILSSCKCFLDEDKNSAKSSC